MTPFTLWVLDFVDMELEIQRRRQRRESEERALLMEIGMWRPL